MDDSKEVLPILFIIIFIVAIIMVIFCSSSNENLIEPSGQTTKRSIEEQYELNGTYILNHDEGSLLNFSDEYYKFYVNTCSGYIELQGKYTRVNNKVSLQNNRTDSEYYRRYYCGKLL